LAYSLVLTYGHWRNRYYFTDIDGKQKQITDDEYEQVLSVYQLALKEIQMAGCEDLVLAVNNLTAQVGLINTAVSGQSGCGCDGGAFDPEALGNEDVPDPSQAYLDGKCETANIIVDKVQYAIRQLDVVNIDVLLLGGISAATAVIGALVLAGPVGWSTVLAIGVISGILLLLAQLGVGELGDIDTVISANQDDLVNALFSAVSTEAAKTAFLAVLDGAAIGAVGQGIVGFMLFNDVLNQLFVPSGTYIGEEYDYLNDDYVASECSAECLNFVEFPLELGGGGSIEALGDNVYRVTATNVGTVDGNYRASIAWQYRPVGNSFCSSTIRNLLDWSIVSGSIEGMGGGLHWRIFDNASPSNNLFANANPPSLPFNPGSSVIGWVVNVSTQPFVVDVEYAG
jgi:hypothetical protein